MAPVVFLALRRSLAFIVDVFSFLIATLVVSLILMLLGLMPTYGYQFLFALWAIGFWTLFHYFYGGSTPGFWLCKLKARVTGRAYFYTYALRNSLFFVFPVTVGLALDLLMALFPGLNQPSFSLFSIAIIIVVLPLSTFLGGGAIGFHDWASGAYVSGVSDLRAKTIGQFWIRSVAFLGVLSLAIHLLITGVLKEFPVPKQLLSPESVSGANFGVGISSDGIKQECEFRSTALHRYVIPYGEDYLNTNIDVCHGTTVGLIWDSLFPQDLIAHKELQRLREEYPTNKYSMFRVSVKLRGIHSAQFQRLLPQLLVKQMPIEHDVVVINPYWNFSVGPWTFGLSKHLWGTKVQHSTGLGFRQIAPDKIHASVSLDNLTDLE